MKRVLFITYHFPPDAEIGAVRPFQIARRLHSYGIEPWILTVEPEFAASPDSELRPDGLPDERIVRTVVDETWRNRLVGAWFRFHAKNPLATGSSDAAGRARGVGPVAPGNATRAIRGAALALLDFPDKYVGWYQPALRAAFEVMARAHFDAVVSTSPPRVAHLIAEALARQTRKPWVMDLRDPWYGEWSWSTLLSGPVKYAHGRLFARCARRSTTVVGNTQRLTNYLAETLPSGTRVACVPNGFDPPHQRGTVGSPPEDFTIGYFGQLMARRSALPFLRGLRAWLERSSTPTSAVQVRFVGSGFEGARRAVQELDLGQIVSLADPVSRNRAAEMMAASYALLLIAQDQPLQVPGKTYEYLATGRRILAVVDASGATSDLLGTVEGCVLAENPESVANALETLWKQWRSGASRTVDRRTFLEACSYDQRAKDFALLIDEAIGRAPLR